MATSSQSRSTVKLSSSLVAVVTSFNGDCVGEGDDSSFDSAVVLFKSFFELQLSTWNKKINIVKLTQIKLIIKCVFPHDERKVTIKYIRMTNDKKKVHRKKNGPINRQEN